jgi:hypothetical protein
MPVTAAPPASSRVGVRPRPNPDVALALAGRWSEQVEGYVGGGGGLAQPPPRQQPTERGRAVCPPDGRWSTRPGGKQAACKRTGQGSQRADGIGQE